MPFCFSSDSPHCFWKQIQICKLQMKCLEMWTELFKPFFFSSSLRGCFETRGDGRAAPPTKPLQSRRIQSGSRMRETGRGCPRKPKAALLSCTCLWRWGEMKARLVPSSSDLAWTPPNPRSSFPLLPLCRAGTFLKETSRNGKHSQHIPPHTHICAAGCLMRQLRLRFRLSAECITAAGAPWGTCTNDPLLISCFILLLMDTVVVSQRLEFVSSFLSAPEHFVFQHVH